MATGAYFSFAISQILAALYKFSEKFDRIYFDLHHAGPTIVIRGTIHDRLH